MLDSVIYPFADLSNWDQLRPDKETHQSTHGNHPGFRTTPKDDVDDGMLDRMKERRLGNSKSQQQSTFLQKFRNEIIFHRDLS